MSKLFTWIRIAIAASLVVMSLGTSVVAQQSAADEAKRKVKTRVSPAYPELARRMNVAGKVKIEIVVAPDGHVRSARPIGGHPLLVQACSDAVKEWKFMPSTEESTQILEFEFKAN